jgi:hypothetical protein
MGARNRVGIGLSYRPARLHRLAEFIPWNRFLGSKTFKNTGSGSIPNIAGSKAKFIVAEWGIQLTPTKGCRPGLPAYVACDGPIRQPYAGVNFIPPVSDYEFGQGRSRNSDHVHLK